MKPAITITIATATVAQLEAIGGRAWTSPKGGERVYFNDLAELYGLELEFYNTGNIYKAKLHGGAISNCRAKRHLADLQNMKVWVADGQLYVRRMFASREGCDYVAAFADAVNHRLAALVEAA